MITFDTDQFIKVSDKDWLVNIDLAIKNNDEQGYMSLLMCPPSNKTRAAIIEDAHKKEFHYSYINTENQIVRGKKTIYNERESNNI